MQVAVIISSGLGWPALQALAAQGGVAAVAVPYCAPAAETEQLAQQVAALGLPVTRLSRPQLSADLTSWLAPLSVAAVLVFTMPWRIPAAVLALPPQGFLNFHLAPLPAYRGPEPLFWLLRNGETTGAVTVHRMDADFDTGPVVLAESVPIGPADTHGLHRAQLAGRAAPVALRLLASLRGEAAPLTPMAQAEAPARYWPRPGLADVCVQWDAPVVTIERLVRATNPWNRGALTTLRGQPLRLLAVTPHPHAATGPTTPGMVLHADPTTGLWVACGTGEALRLDMVALDEGYFTGLQLLQLGVGTGEILGSSPLPG
ncbi:formyltransferase family protein [Hymenobacter sp. ASUV-10]|uniref:Formyltransferase family protein n=1 Tax=Hymenobacter aranciens TaxID=3063996 RepID=A0ABT9BI75_9BACT|nr:formyltransferase family protein [Hymenobacter sp. ASUV-10]MDO7877404.1 formyltransferase family protein [Hymenobacter sp. ASUV-10]